jgi:hypothetical protein
MSGTVACPKYPNSVRKVSGMSGTCTVRKSEKCPKCPITRSHLRGSPFRAVRFTYKLTYIYHNPPHESQIPGVKAQGGPSPFTPSPLSQSRYHFQEAMDLQLHRSTHHFVCIFTCGCAACACGQTPLPQRPGAQQALPIRAFLVSHIAYPTLSGCAS